MLSGKAYAPEFYYDARSALWQNRPRVYGFKLQWTQMEPGAVDRILAYRLGFRQVSLDRAGLRVRLVPERLCLCQMGQSRWWERQIPMEGTIQKGELLTYNLTELIKPESYLVRLTPITRFGEGDTTERVISYSSKFASNSFQRRRLHLSSSVTSPCVSSLYKRCLTEKTNLEFAALTEPFCPFTAPVNPHLSKFLLKTSDGIFWIN